VGARDQQLSRKQKVSDIVLRAKLLSTRARLLWDRGPQREALQLQAQSVILIQRIWKSLEANEDEPSSANESNDAASLVVSVDEAFSKLALGTKNIDQSPQPKNPLFRTLAPVLCAGLLQLSHMIYWSGLYEDALYYTEQALQTARIVKSKALEGAALVRCGELRSRGGDLAEGHRLLKQADIIYTPQNEEVDVVAHKLSLGLLHHIEQEWPIELQVYEGATKLVDRLYKNNNVIPKWSSESRAAERNVTTDSKAKVVKRAPTSQSISRVIRKAESKPASTSDGISLQFRILRERLLRSRTEALMAQGDLEDASALFPLFSMDNIDIDLQVQQDSTIARKLLLDGFSQMSADPTFSTLSESVISLPSAVRPRRRGSALIVDRVMVHEGISKKSNKNATATGRATNSTVVGSLQPPSCGTVFVQAYETAFSTAAKMSQLCSVTTISQAVAAGTTSALLTSFAFPDSSKTIIQPAQLAWSLGTCCNAKQEY